MDRQRYLALERRAYYSVSTNVHNALKMRTALFILVFSISSGAYAIEASMYEYTPSTCGNPTGHLGCLAWGGEEPYTFQWSPEPGSGQGTPFANGLTPGDYEVLITDALGATITVSYSVSEVPGLLTPSGPVTPLFSCAEPCSANFNISAQALGGATPYSVAIDPPGPTWSYVLQSLRFQGFCSSTLYTITITDAYGCSSVLSLDDVTDVPLPQIIGETMTPSCPLGITGSIELLFDRPVTMFHSWVYTDSEYGNSPYHKITGLPPGEVPIFVGGNSTGCIDTLVLFRTIPEYVEECGTVSGTVYADMDNNCVQDPGEPGIPFATCRIMPSEDLFLTDAQGNYVRHVLFGDHTLETIMDDYDQPCSSTANAFTLTELEPTAMVDVALDPLFGPDASAQVSCGPLRPGFPTNIWLRVSNNGPYMFTDLSATYVHAAVQTFVSASVVPSNVAPATLSWTIPVLAPFEQWEVNVVMETAPDPLLIGTFIEQTLALTNDVPDEDPLNDIHSITSPILGAYDPNDKLARTSSQSDPHSYYSDMDEYVDYTIRFQNTGNAEAINVYLLDTIQAALDPISLHVLGGSHPFTVQWVDERVIRFDLPLIMLPDSASDPLGSQGFVSFRMRPNGVPTAGEYINNAADIYFDFNPPIRTNTAELLVGTIQHISERINASMRSWPNPVEDALYLELGDVPNGAYRILDAQGRDMLQGRWQKGHSIVMRGLAPGLYTVLIPEYGTAIKVVKN